MLAKCRSSTKVGYVFGDHNDAVTTPYDFLLGPPCHLDQQPGGMRAPMPRSSWRPRLLAAATAACLHRIVLAQVGKSFISRSTSSVLLRVLSCYLLITCSLNHKIQLEHSVHLLYVRNLQNESWESEWWYSNPSATLFSCRISFFRGLLLLLLVQRQCSVLLVLRPRYDLIEAQLFESVWSDGNSMFFV
jgi:hypothetical protein